MSGSECLRKADHPHALVIAMLEAALRWRELALSRALFRLVLVLWLSDHWVGLVDNSSYTLNRSVYNTFASVVGVSTGTAQRQF